jgi:hypothetical protein
MARYVHLRLTGQAESFLADMERRGLTERDVFSNALGLLREAWTTKRVARLSAAASDSTEGIEYIYELPLGEASSSSHG